MVYNCSLKLSLKNLVLSFEHDRPPFESTSSRDQTANLNEIFNLLLSPTQKEQLRLRRLDNESLFQTYIDELRLRNLSPFYIQKVWELLRVFKVYLNGAQPTTQLAKLFLTQYITPFTGKWLKVVSP